MKMSESFSLPVSVKYQRDYCDEYVTNINDRMGDVVFPVVPDDINAEAIAHAINMHDELVEAMLAMRRDLKSRAEINDDGVYIVACRQSVWERFNKALDEAL